MVLRREKDFLTKSLDLSDLWLKIRLVSAVFEPAYLSSPEAEVIGSNLSGAPKQTTANQAVFCFVCLWMRT